MKKYLKNINLLLLSLLGILLSCATFAFSNSNTERNDLLKARWGNSSNYDEERNYYRRNSSLTVDKATIDKAAQAAKKFRNVSDTRDTTPAADTNTTVAPSVDTPIINAPAADTTAAPSVDNSVDNSVNTPAADTTVAPSVDASINTPATTQPTQAAPLSADTTEKPTDVVDKTVDEAATKVDSVKTTDDEASAEEDKDAAIIESAEKPVQNDNGLRSDKDTYLTPGSMLNSAPKN